MFHFFCPDPVCVRTNSQTYRETVTAPVQTYRDSLNIVSVMHKHMLPVHIVKLIVSVRTNKFSQTYRETYRLCLKCPVVIQRVGQSCRTLTLPQVQIRSANPCNGFPIYSFEKIFTVKFTPFHSSDKDNESCNPSRKRDKVPPKMMRI